MMDVTPIKALTMFFVGAGEPGKPVTQEERAFWGEIRELSDASKMELATLAAEAMNVELKRR